MPDKDPARIRSMFDEISPRYDFLNHALSLNFDRTWRTRVAGVCPFRGLILDVCTGTGDLAFAIRRRDRRVIGVDFSPRMLQIAQAKARRNGASGTPFLAGDALRLPFRDNTFDAATVAFGIRNTADPLQAICEMTRVVKSNGRIVLLEFAIPRSRLIAAPYLFYFRRILPCLGNMISRSRRNAYGYLNASAEEFPSGEAFLDLMRRAGLDHARAEALTLGTVMLYLGEKPRTGAPELASRSEKT